MKFPGFVGTEREKPEKDLMLFRCSEEMEKECDKKKRWEKCDESLQRN